MVKKIYNCYINSKNRDISDFSYNFKIDLSQSAITAGENEHITLNIVSFDMINSMYNVSSVTGNNKFSIIKTDANGISNAQSFSYTIPNGNYDVNSLCNILNGLFNNNIQVKYNQYQNTYTYTKTDLSSSRYFLIPLNCSKLLGISISTEITSAGITGTYVNMVNYNKVILTIENLAFNRFQNLSDNDNVLNNGDVIFWITKSDVAPFKMISYNNVDGGSSFSCDIHNKEVSLINFTLMNEYNNYITDAPDFLLGIQFIVEPYEIKEINQVLKRILNYTNEIFDLFVLLLKYIGFFNDVDK